MDILPIPEFKLLSYFVSLEDGICGCLLLSVRCRLTGTTRREGQLPGIQLEAHKADFIHSFIHSIIHSFGLMGQRLNKPINDVLLKSQSQSLFRLLLPLVCFRRTNVWHERQCQRHDDAKLHSSKQTPRIPRSAVPGATSQRLIDSMRTPIMSWITTLSRSFEFIKVTVNGIASTPLAQSFSILRLNDTFFLQCVNTIPHLTNYLRSCRMQFQVPRKYSNFTSLYMQ